jgi:hypothetical protein
MEREIRILDIRYNILSQRTVVLPLHRYISSAIYSF